MLLRHEAACAGTSLGEGLLGGFNERVSRALNELLELDNRRSIEA
jgi:hypothetical protein